MDTNRLKALAGVPLMENVANSAFVAIVSEEDTTVVEMSVSDATEAKRLLQEAQETGEWPEAVNDIINRSTPIKTIGTINTMGDGWGWYSENE